MVDGVLSGCRSCYMGYWCWRLNHRRVILMSDVDSMVWKGVQIWC